LICCRIVFTGTSAYCLSFTGQADFRGNGLSLLLFAQQSFIIFPFYFSSLWSVETYPALVVALIKDSIFVLDGSKVTVAVFVLNSDFTLTTPGTFFKALRMVIGQNFQVIPGTSSVMVLLSAADTFCDRNIKPAIKVKNKNVVRKIACILKLLNCFKFCYSKKTKP